MPKRVLLIVIAVVVAAGILVATLLAPAPETDGGDGPVVIDPEDVNTAIDVTGDAPTRGIPIEVVDRGEFTRVEDDKVVRVTWARATPLPQGRSAVERPRAVILFESGRVLEVTADRGEFVAPDNQPTSGLFRGNVVITLRDTDPAEPVDFADESTVEARVFIEDGDGTGEGSDAGEGAVGEARFDLVLNQIESPDRVHLTGPRVEFFGGGLELNYNQRRNRLERLEVARGEVLRLKPETAGGIEDAEDDQDAGETAATGVAGASDKPPVDAGGDPAAGAAADADADEITYYRARFRDEVRILASAEGAELLGDAFELAFATAGGVLSDDGVGGGGESARSMLHSSLSSSTKQPLVAGGDNPLVIDGVPVSRWAYQPTAQRGPRSLFVPGEDDVIVHWSGRLSVLPIETDAAATTDPTADRESGGARETPASDPPPLGLAGPDDVLMTLTGRPAVATTADGRRIAAAEIDYLGSTRRVRAAADDITGLELVAGELGTLTGRRLVYDASAAQASVEGPGRLTREAQAEAETDAPARSFDVAWRNRLDMTFYAAADPADGETARTMDAGIGTLRSAAMPLALRRATFTGEARATHPRLRLAGERVRLDFADPADAGAPNRPRRVEAEGEAALELIDPDPRQAAEVRGGSIAIDLDEADARPAVTHAEPAEAPAVAIHDEQTDHEPRDPEGPELYPARLLATGDASVTRAGAALSAQRIDASFAPRPPSDNRSVVADRRIEASGDAAQPGNRIDLTALEAIGGVTLDVPDEGLVMTGRRLTVDPDTEVAELFGADGRPAVARRDDGFITGDRLVLDQPNLTLRVPGPGSFEALLDPDARDQTLNIDWTESMSFDRNAGLARFAGGVRALAIGPEEVTELTSGGLDVQLQLDPPGSNPGSDAPIDRDAEADAADDAPAYAAIRRVTARDDALLKARTFATDPAGRPLTRLRMDGPMITFINQPETAAEPAVERVQVVGEGSMQVEDYRPPSLRAAPGDPPLGRVDGVTGRGATLLLFDRRLTLDAVANDLIAVGGVMMIHRPEDTAPGRGAPGGEAAVGETIQLDARRLVADLAETGGLGAWLGDAPPTPELDRVDAEGAVRVVRGDKTILADRLEYARATDAIRFAADEGGFVRVTREGQRADTRARSVIYHVGEDRLEAYDVIGSGAVGR